MPSRFFRPCRIPAAVIGGLTLLSVAIAQTPTSAVPTYMAPERGVLSLRTNLGSFRVQSRGPIPVQGKFSISFTGTILISGMKGTIVPSGNIRREINDTKHGRQVYFGTGKLVMNGEFKAVQWFGRNMNAVFDGYGTFKLYGEYDKALNTGEYSYDNFATKKKWETYGTQADVPVTTSGLLKPLQPRDKLPAKSGKG